MSENFYHLLSTHRLEIVEVLRRRYPASHREPEAVVPTARLVTVEKGTLRYDAETQNFTLEAPASIFVPVWCKRHWESMSGRAPVLHWISFSMPFVHPLASTPSVTTSPPSLLAIDGFERILKRWNGRPQVNAYIEAELKTLLVAFFEQSENQGTAPDSSPGSGLAEVRQLIHWLENNYQDPNALTRISEECQLNPDYFRRLFKRETGVTPGGYLKRLRMQSARYYLHDTPLRIQEIAQRVGMEDQRYFSKQYRSFWGKSPSDERIFE